MVHQLSVMSSKQHSAVRKLVADFRNKRLPADALKRSLIGAGYPSSDVGRYVDLIISTGL